MRDVFERMAWDMAFAKKSVRTQKIYLSDAKAFAAFHGRSPEEMGQPEVMVWVEHLVERQVSPSRLRQHLAALTFLYRKTPLPGLWRGHGADQRENPRPACASWRMRCLTSSKRIHRSKRLGTRPASCWPPGWRPPQKAEGNAPFRRTPLSKITPTALEGAKD